MNHTDKWSRRLYREVGNQPLVSEFVKEVRRSGEALARCCTAFQAGMSN
ncbi:MAG: hypothetical protein ACREGJ_04280 [Candidatus Saccharimonadales bacterium]